MCCVGGVCIVGVIPLFGVLFWITSVCIAGCCFSGVCDRGVKCMWYVACGGCTVCVVCVVRVVCVLLV